MSFLSTALFAVLLPAAVAAGLVGLGRWSGKPWWTASAVGLAYSAGHWALARPTFPPSDVTDRLPFLALAAVALAVFERRVKSDRVILRTRRDAKEQANTTLSTKHYRAARAVCPNNPRKRMDGRGEGGSEPVVEGMRGPLERVVGRVLLASLTLGLVLAPVVGNGASSGWLFAPAAIVLAAWANVELPAARGDGSDAYRSLLVTAGGAGLVLLLSGSAVLGQLGVALTAALVAAGVASGMRTPLGFAPAGAAVLVGLVLTGFVYGSLPAPSAFLLAAAPATAWLSRIGPARRFGPWATAALVAVPVGAAVALAVSASPAFDY